MTARRMLFGAGAGPFAAIAAGVLDLTSEPEGGWSWYEDPRAIANANGYTYIGYNEGGDLKVAAVTAGAVVNTVTLHTALEYDDHDTPTCYVRPDGKLHCFYSKHIGPNIYERISATSVATDPDLTDGFAAENSLSSTFGASNSTYPSPYYLANVDGAGDSIFLFWREHVTGDPYWWYAAHDFSTGWSGHTSLHAHTYSKIATDGVGRIDVALSDHPNTGADKIWHLYRESAAWRKSDGTAIGGGLPIGAGSMTEVYAATGAELVWISDCALDGSGDPVLVFARYPAGDGSDIRYMYAAWNGSSWDVNEICAAGTYIPDSVVGMNPIEEFYHGGLSLDQADPRVVYASREVSGQWELFRYTTNDGGASFSEEALTDGSTGKQIRPVGVREANDIRVVWLYGTYHSYVDYSLGIRGLS